MVLQEKGSSDLYRWCLSAKDRCSEIDVCGTPETVAEHPTSHTGRYLKEVLKQHPPEVLAG